MKYFFILGRNPTLSSAEIAAALGERIAPDMPDNSRGGRAIFNYVSSETITAEISGHFHAIEFMSRLGGTIKIGEIIQMDIKMFADDYANVIANAILKSLPNNKKIYFGFSFYKLEEEISVTDLKKTSDKIKNLAIPVKDLLKDMKIQARWVTSKGANLSSVVVKKNKLLTESGAELVFLIGRNKIYLGKTLAVQEFENLSFRDYGRPARSMRVGLMPPKLAKVMINLAQVGKDATILDPFCGFATILEEAMLWGYKNLIGSDINAETLAGAKENLEWLKKNYQLPITNYQLLECDVHRLSEKLSPHSIDAIVTEPYLGPPLHGNESSEKIKEIIKELSELYLAAFREFKKILKPDGRIVILFPVFRAALSSFSKGGGRRPEDFSGGRDGEGRFNRSPFSKWRDGEGFLPIIDEIKKIDFSVADPLPKEFKKYLFLEITPRNSILYFRPDQLVRREILIFTPKK
jgi:tRNA G10  N-methylase Trm11